MSVRVNTRASLFLIQNLLNPEPPRTGTFPVLTLIPHRHEKTGRDD